MPNLRGASPVGRDDGGCSCVARADGRCGRTEITWCGRWATGPVEVVNTRGPSGRRDVASSRWDCPAGHRRYHLK